MLQKTVSTANKPSLYPEKEGTNVHESPPEVHHRHVADRHCDDAHLSRLRK